MSTNGNGIRDISHVLGISQNTVIKVLKKQKITNKYKLQIHKPRQTAYHTFENG
ncbi:MAG: hypothetical protein LBQ98_00885 [Nitrososphaerota archaeon]|jgi:hypothetical protein|nr:hypothetical protein [Nitrososphaerota archaeon]